MKHLRLPVCLQPTCQDKPHPNKFLLQKSPFCQPIVQTVAEHSDRMKPSGWMRPLRSALIAAAPFARSPMFHEFRVLKSGPTGVLTSTAPYMVRCKCREDFHLHSDK